MQPVPIISAGRTARHYLDPVDLIWIATARRLGMTIARSNQVYASWNGVDTLTLGTPETLDSDDCLAQLIFHEICHWLTNGADSVHQIDWGFNPTEHVDWKEYPAVRLQGWLAQPHGLRQVLGPTTNARPYYDRVAGVDVALDDSAHERRIVTRAKRAVALAQTDPWWEPLQRALIATAEVHRAVQRMADDEHLWSWPTDRAP